MPVWVAGTSGWALASVSSNSPSTCKTSTFSYSIIGHGNWSRLPYLDRAAGRAPRAGRPWPADRPAGSLANNLLVRAAFGWLPSPLGVDAKERPYLLACERESCQPQLH